MDKLLLPSLRGKFGDWIYFVTIMKVKDIVNPNRIITVPESKDLYSNNINKILQREINPSRIGKIKKYLVHTDERFLSSLIVAIHKGNPQWASLRVESDFKIDADLIPENSSRFIGDKLGVLTLSGNETMFVLDGQHRLRGIRVAAKEDSKNLDDEVSIILIVHQNNLIERTRRLFTVLNKYAEKPKEAELIILDEDDSASILTRRLIENHNIFLKNNAMSDSKSSSLSAKDFQHFTTLVTINRINRILLKDFRIDFTKRPTNEQLNLYYNEIIKFWDFLFTLFPEIIEFIDGKEVYLNRTLFNRNNQTGGSLLLRPVGQILFAHVYHDYSRSEAKRKIFEKYIRNIDFNLSGPTWNYIFWNTPKMLSKEDKLKKNLIPYLLGDREKEAEINQNLKKIYESYNLIYDNHIKPIVN